MGIFGEIFGGSEKNADFKAGLPSEAAAETSINPEDKQDILPDASTYTAETGRMVADAENVQEIPTSINSLEAVMNELQTSKEELPQQN